MKFSMYELSIIGYMWRFFLMMGIVIVAVFTGATYFALLGSVVFLSMMLGVKIEWNKKEETRANVVQMNNEAKTRKQAS